MSVYSAENGQAAIELAANYPEINIVLMDIKMPVMNGYNATREIKKRRPDLPVIAQTAYSSKGDQEKAYKPSRCYIFFFNDQYKVQTKLFIVWCAYSFSHKVHNAPGKAITGQLGFGNIKP